MRSAIEGVWAPTLTPLTDKLDIDHGLLAEHCGRLLADGCDGIVLFGSTGEAPSFSVRERAATLKVLLDRGLPPDRVVVGTGCPALPDTVELSRQATEAGTRGVLVMPPYFYKNVSAEGVAGGYLSLCEQIGADLQLYLYHFPALSMVPITPTIITSIQERFADNLVGLKDSSGQINGLHSFLNIEGLAVLPGTERLMLEGSRHGGRGVITATANISAPIIASVWENRPTPGVDESTMLAIRTVIEAEGTIPTMKAWLASRTGYEGWGRVRAPLAGLPPQAATASNAELSRLMSVE